MDRWRRRRCRTCRGSGRGSGRDDGCRNSAPQIMTFISDLLLIHHLCCCVLYRVVVCRSRDLVIC